ncbi:anti-repressor SinI family protein [Paenibacillus agricola]|uniref:DNA-binding anti-repressor SinI n=1 Tax=Paenibacillus agricola TaxID=2716264 RepID=A0ABX0J6F0_9BACL|nr:anti-repressor SinI family protein [Paenibacillus agricola]NHN31934.1 DNA-binding anti-repressor SinI [Paenibacillus agricola]
MYLSTPITPMKNLDENWIQLMIAARNMGVSKEEVLHFIRQLKKQNKSRL